MREHIITDIQEYVERARAHNQHKITSWDKTKVNTKASIGIH